jgi:hypothetical protein
MRRAFAIQVLVCERCGGSRRILGAVTEPHAVRRVLANARDDQRPAGHAVVALYARGGSAPELIVVARDGAGELRSASWALRPTEDPGRAESAPRQLTRGAAGAVDVGTAPLQWLLLLLGVVRIH